MKWTWMTWLMVFATGILLYILSTPHPLHHFLGW
jgi:hypothetical protein